MTDPPPRREPPTDDAALILESRERPEVFARLYDRHAADIHRYASIETAEPARTVMFVCGLQASARRA